ncbi:hypothetical protein ACQEVF_59425 [Nonomuraea polychroma]|uniref:hypothetical protein n=1 Tax=Nonomuraea polychroma TaxID=46176 RepID=UPI003D8F6E86
MNTMITRTRAELRATAMEVREAGATTTQILQTVARMLTGPAATLEKFERNVADVLDTAGFWFDELSDEYIRELGSTPYPWQTAKFDDLTGRDQAWVVGRVIQQFGDPDVKPERPAPIRLADQLLTSLRRAAALKVEFGDHFMPVYRGVRDSLITLLGTQSVDRELALEAIDHALTTGKGIAEAVAHLDGQL